MAPGERSAAPETAGPAGTAVTGLVSAIRRLAIHDGPGIRTLVFLKGCPLCCAWCAAPETQAPGRDVVFHSERCLACDRCRTVCPTGAIRLEADGRRVLDRMRCDLCGACAEACYAEAISLPGERRSVAEVLAEVVRDRVFYERSGGGVTLSGGEPLSQPEFTAALLAACRGAGLHTALETSGYQAWERFEGLLADADLLLYDVKLMDAERHRRFTGVGNALILDNLRRAVARGVATIVRVPVVAGINDDCENARALARFLSGAGPIRRVDLLPYHRLGEATYARLGRSYALPGIPLVAESRLEALAGILAETGLPVQIGG
jgi:pyruvate formate lyase activating enzyme